MQEIVPAVSHSSLWGGAGYCVDTNCVDTNCTFFYQLAS